MKCVSILVLALCATAVVVNATYAGRVKETLSQLANDHGSDVKVHKHRSGAVSAVRVGEGYHSRMASRGVLDSTLSPIHSFLSHYNVLGLDKPEESLVEITRETAKRELDTEHASYQQHHAGVPVYGAFVRVSEKAGNLNAFSSSVVADVESVRVTPTLSPQAAVGLAISAFQPVADRMLGTNAPDRKLFAVVMSHGEHEPTPEDTAQLVIVQEGLATPSPGRLRLTYRVDVANSGRAIHERVFVDAVSGDVVEHFPLVADALFRRVTNTTLNGTLEWIEGDPLPTPGTGLSHVVRAAKWTYQLFNFTYGIDSWNNAGGKMLSVYPDPNIACPNAFWNGVSTNFCYSTAVVDVVGHEWSHAYTDGGPNSTHGLIYMWQSGALNEAYSDMFGETVNYVYYPEKLTPDGVRPVGSCSAYQPSMELGMVLTLPTFPDFGEYEFSPALQPANASFGDAYTGTMVAATDGTQTGNELCFAATNALTGKVAVIMRGGCSFEEKAQHAYDAGAAAVIIVNNDDGVTFGPGGVDAIPIPVGMAPQDAGSAILSLLGLMETLPVALDIEDVDLADSYRWLMGEDAPGFGGAIRDLWNPTCFGHPGKVTDPEYHCEGSDGGGVHSNSGVPNHAFALVTDGGVYNNVSVAGIGRTRTVHIYMQAMFVYQTPTTDFSQHADYLSLACTDLIGAPLTDIHTGELTNVTIAQEHCDAINAAADATELRATPPCGWEPLLAPGYVAPCENFTATYNDSLDSTPTGWTLSSSGADPGDFDPINWVWTTDLPGGEAGGAWFAANPDNQNCVITNAGTVTVTSPDITVTDAGTAYVSIRHYVASEADFDGGVIRYTVNGGAAKTVGIEDFSFNGYNLRLQDSTINTNPLAGEWAFSGANQGSLLGSWGYSVFSIEATEGDVVNIEFVFGQDSCAGLTGWYIGSVELGSCVPTCGDGMCVWPENCNNCPNDCVCPCGNGICEPNENAADCPLDCCGDGICRFDEVCAADCCGPLPDCSFETIDTWSASPANINVFYTNTDLGFGSDTWPSGEQGVVVAGLAYYGIPIAVDYSVATTFVPEVNVETVTLKFYWAAFCADMGVNVIVNGESVWTPTDCTSYTSGDLTSGDFTEEVVDISDHVVGGAVNNISIDASLQFSVFFFDHFQMETTCGTPAGPTSSPASATSMMSSETTALTFETTTLMETTEVNNLSSGSGSSGTNATKPTKGKAPAWVWVVFGFGLLALFLGVALAVISYSKSQSNPELLRFGRSNYDAVDEDADSRA